MVLNPRAVLAAALAAVLASTASARAQTPSPSPGPSHAEYVEVTATRFPEQADEVPAAIEVISGDELRDWGAVDLRSALGLAAGLDISPGGDGGPAGAVPEFWGLKEFDAFLLVVDGVPWGGAFNPALATLNLDDVERIEVQRGAAPVMYGATSFVGVIQIVHRNAGASKGFASLSGGSYSTWGGVLTTALPEWQGFSSSLSIDGRRQGFRDDRTAFRRGHLLWRNSRAAGTGLLRFDADGTWLDQDPASPHPRQGPALSTLVPIDANHNPDSAFLNERRVTVSTGYDRPLTTATWSTVLSYSHSSQGIFRGFLADLSNSTPNARGFRENIGINDVYFDTHLAWAGSSRVKVVAGLDHLHGNGEASGADFDYFAPLNGSFAAVVTEPSVLDVKIEDKREFSGLYSFVEWNPAPAWRFEVGARLNRTAEDREGGEGEEEAGASEEGRDREVWRLSGSGGATWTAWQRGADRLRLFTIYRENFKPAAFDFGIGEGEEGEEGERILEPETSRSFEAGLKARLLEGRLSLEVSGYLMDFRNLVLSQVVNGLPDLINGGKERFKGVELAAAWRLAQGLSGRATYSLHDARFRDFLTEFDGVPTQLAGKRFELSAHHLASAGLLYARPRGVLAAVQLGWVGARFLNKRNTALADGYGTLAASLGYRSGRFEVRADGWNLSDERAPVSESELGDAQYYRLPARRIDLTASLRF
jgi:iron complex outermembrane recepter protein